MGALVPDTSVVIGFVRKHDARHPVARTEIHAARLREDTFVLPASVLAESLVAAYRAGPAIADEMRHDLVAFFGPVRPADEEVADVAARLRAGVGTLRLPDALVIATGIVEDARVLTCDRRLAGIDARVQVIGSD